MPIKNQRWHSGFDWLRAGFICFVVCMHLNVMQTMSGQTVSVTIFDLIHFNLLCVAVPGFLLISHFLLFQKCHTWPDFRTRIKDSISLYLFWVGAWVLVTKSKPEFSLVGLVEFFLRGGGWAYYFFAVLILNTLICAAISRLSSRVMLCGFLVSAVATQALFHMLANNQHAWMKSATYWWPACFVSIPFAAGLLDRWLKQIISSSRSWWLALLCALVLSIALSSLEWSHRGSAGLIDLRPFLPEYLRISLVFSACVLFLLALKINYVPRFIKFISRNSLGIFCLHVFVLGGVHQGVSRWVHQEQLAYAVTIAVVLIFGAIGSEILRIILRSRVI